MARGRKDLLSLSVEQFSESSLPLSKLHCPTTSSCSGRLLLSVMESSLERVLLSATDTTESCSAPMTELAFLINLSSLCVSLCLVLPKM